MMLLSFFASTEFSCRPLYYAEEGRVSVATASCVLVSGKGTIISYIRSENVTHRGLLEVHIRSSATWTKNGKACNKLSLIQIIHFVYNWLYGQESTKQSKAKTGLNKDKITKWNGLCRDVFRRLLQRRPKFSGTAIAPVQIDEAYFAGKRKNNTGHYRKWEVKPEGENLTQADEGLEGMVGL